MDTPPAKLSGSEDNQAAQLMGNQALIPLRPAITDPLSALPATGKDGICIIPTRFSFMEA
ncbi:hypothetical protein LZZ85_06025 [Terrimonas sp. NA20]|uniref:Uncharacterized protein n=1 Tax=Terrimonas ginsenosidimutans TaxID=2908004 RepID=A0ABS9KNC1_9BACT|nr:hypothetical protein [Terrimonas ginsenosidimutans]MCG2613827.1 hypothetical protein [Terrimonas ginsenosidimutans]